MKVISASIERDRMSFELSAPARGSPAIGLPLPGQLPLLANDSLSSVEIDQRLS